MFFLAVVLIAIITICIERKRRQRELASQESQNAVPEIVANPQQQQQQRTVIETPYNPSSFQVKYTATSTQPDISRNFSQTEPPNYWSAVSSSNHPTVTHQDNISSNPVFDSS